MSIKIDSLPTADTKNSDYFFIYQDGIAKKIQYSAIYKEMKEYADAVIYGIKSFSWWAQSSKTWGELETNTWGDIAGEGTK